MSKLQQHITFVHFLQYLTLVFLIASTVILYIKLNYSMYRFTLIIVSSSLYIVWGIWHHLVDKNLTLKILLEYILIAITVIILTTYILFA